MPVETLSVDEYRIRHGAGASVELKNEELRIQAFNDDRSSFPAWVLRPLPKLKLMNGGRQEWLVLVLSPLHDKTFPRVGESCSLGVDNTAVIDGKRVTTGLMPAVRIDNPFEGSVPTYAAYAAFTVLPPMEEGVVTVATKVLKHFSAVKTHGDLDSQSLRSENSVNVIMRVKLILTSYRAEMSALNHLSEPKRDKYREAHPHSKDAFTWTLDFNQEPPISIDLFDTLPHMKNPLDSDLPQKLIDMFTDLNEDHLAAYYGLSKVPARLHMVSGCPGAGKTHWNLLVAAIAQAKPAILVEEKTSEDRLRRAKILYLIDVNKPVDDVADRMFCLCKGSGLDRTIIRMYGWPYELRQSEYVDAGARRGLDAALDLSPEDSLPDFTFQFLAVAQKGARPKVNKAPTLDQAAWEYFRKHRSGQYVSLAKVLDKLLEEGTQTPQEALSLRGCVYRLYEDVLKQADFIATTPVSSYGSLSEMFRADIVFVDEAPHARELTSLIPIAFFSPIVWIFTGDFRQTRPFVSTPAASDNDSSLLANPYGKQMAVSMMERADRVGALKHNLFINHRCYGNLERLASKLFYGGNMRSGIPLEKRHPKSLAHLHKYIDRLVGHHCFEPRVLVHIIGAQEGMEARSYFNTQHQEWVMARIKELLADDKFRRVDDTDKPGNIMIIAAYQAAISHYKVLVRDLDQSVQARVDIRTVDTAQGHQSDVVFLDMVRTRGPGFMDDAHRLCVAITRARQAEFIIMNPRMLRRRVERRLRDTEYLMPMWRDVYDRGQYVRVEEEPAAVTPEAETPESETLRSEASGTEALGVKAAEAVAPEAEAA